MMPVTPSPVHSSNSMRYVDIASAAPIRTVSLSSSKISLLSSASVSLHQKRSNLKSSSVGYHPSTPLYSRVTVQQSLQDGKKDTFFAPSFLPEFHHQVSPKHSFVPLSHEYSSLAAACDTDYVPHHQSNNFSFFNNNNNNKNNGTTMDDNSTPPASPFDLVKNVNKEVSPTLSARTAVTVDSFESTFASLRSPNPSPSVDRKALPYIPTSKSFSAPVTTRSGRRESSSSNADMSSLQRALWVPPRNIAVRQLLEHNTGATYPAPSYSSVSTASPPVQQLYALPSPSPTNSRNKALFSPAREEQDPNRKSRLKTELCLHYINKTQCPFGVNCTYAHGEEELQLTKLMDLHEAGLVDVATYRTVPCLTFVSTGSCPFGKRCHAIHDPRVAGSVQSWLPHTETQGNTIATDINVDALHQKRLYSTLHNNPFGALFTPGNDSFQDLCNLVCNAEKISAGMTHIGTKKKKVPLLGEHHKLSVALQMRGGSNFQFKFRPQHIIFDELCMVLQKRAFRLTNEEAVEIPLSMYNSRSAKDILVREIAFGPDCDSTVRGVGLWFGILESDVTVCTPQQAKRFRWKRGGMAKNKGKNDSSTSSFRSTTSFSKFESRESFAMIRPAERDAYGLTTTILNHRLAVLKADRINDMCERAISLDRLEIKRGALEEYFKGLDGSWTNWSWPVNEGRAHVDATTAVPSVDGAYKPVVGEVKATTKSNKNNKRADKQEKAITPSPVDSIWKNFAQSDFESAESALMEMDEEKINDFALPTNEDLDMEDSRLKVFKRLSESFSLPSCDDEVNTLPHISDTNDGFQEIGTHVAQSRRCWKSLLLKPTSLNEFSEWQIVQEHFQNSRSRKVLSILQQ